MGTLGCINDMLQRDWGSVGSPATGQRKPRAPEIKQRTPKGNPKQAHENREQYQTTRYIR